MAPAVGEPERGPPRRERVGRIERVIGRRELPIEWSGIRWRAPFLVAGCAGSGGGYDGNGATRQESGIDTRALVDWWLSQVYESFRAGARQREAVTWMRGNG